MVNRYWIPLPYQVILKRLELDSFDDKIEGSRARKILTHVCRIPKNLAGPVINEMIKYSWILMDRWNEVTIIKKVDVELMPLHPSRSNNSK